MTTSDNTGTQELDKASQALIWTTKGNVLLSSLDYHHEWQDSEDATVFIEEHRLAGEVVKRSVHVMSKRGLTAEATASSVT